APARPGAQVRMTCEGFDADPGKQAIDIPLPEGAMRFEHEVTFANKLARKRVRLTVEGLPSAGTDGVDKLYVTFEDLPAVFLPQEEEPLERIETPTEDDEDDLAGAFELMFRPEPDEWISPPGPYAHHDKVV